MIATLGFLHNLEFGSSKERFNKTQADKIGKNRRKVFQEETTTHDISQPPLERMVSVLAARMEKMSWKMDSMGRAISSRLSEEVPRLLSELIVTPDILVQI